MASHALIPSGGGGGHRRPAGSVRGSTALSVAGSAVVGTIGGMHGGGGASISTSGGGRPSLTSTVASRPTTGKTRAGAGGAVRPPQVLTCNRCTQPLATTCYLTRCDCVFCEECTFSHFGASSDCPKCGRTLGEADFTELIVSGAADGGGGGGSNGGAGAAGSTAELSKASLQALFSNQHPATGHLPHPDLCRALLRQFDVVRSSTKFVLKQMIVEAGAQGAARGATARQNRRYQAQAVQMKKEYNALKLGHERQKREFLQRDTGHQKRVADLQAQIKERDDRIAQFEAMVGSRVPGGGGGGGRPSNSSGGRGAGMVPPHSTSTGGSSSLGAGGGIGRSSLASSRMGSGRPSNGHHGGGGGGGGGSVIDAFVSNQQQASHAQDLALRQRQNPLASAQGRRSGSLNGMGGGPHGGGMIRAGGGGGGMMPAPPIRQSIGGGGMTQQQMQHAQMRMMQQQHQQQQLQMQHQHHQQQRRQRSSHSSSNLSLGGVEPPPTPGNRIRDVSNMPYQFTSGASSMQDASSFGGGGGGGRANKRRRGTANSAHSRESFGLGMDSSTAGMLNAGPHTQRKY